MSGYGNSANLLQSPQDIPKCATITILDRVYQNAVIVVIVVLLTLSSRTYEKPLIVADQLHQVEMRVFAQTGRHIENWGQEAFVIDDYAAKIAISGQRALFLNH